MDFISNQSGTVEDNLLPLYLQGRGFFVFYGGMTFYKRVIITSWPNYPFSIYKFKMLWRKGKEKANLLRSLFYSKGKKLLTN